MVSAELVQSIHSLSINDKLALIEEIIQMLQKELPFQMNGVAKEQKVGGRNIAQHLWQEQPSQDIQNLVTDLLNRASPPREKMLKRGMFQGRVPVDEEIFRLAEWHPTDEEMIDG